MKLTDKQHEQQQEKRAEVLKKELVKHKANPNIRLLKKDQMLVIARPYNE